MKQDRLPPQNMNAERAVLGSLILGNDEFPKVAELIGRADFYADVHGSVFEAMVDLREAGEPLDVVTLANALESLGSLSDVGGPPYLMELMEAVPIAAHAAYYAAIVAECSRRRKAIDIGQKLIAGAYDFGSDEGLMTSAAIAAASKLSESLTTTKTARTLEEHAFELLDNLEKGIAPAKFWGLGDIDSMTKGIAVGELVIIGARPSHGKSLLGLQWLLEASRRGVASLMISEEMAAVSIASRAIASATCVDSERWVAELSRVRFDAREMFTGRAPILIAEKCGTIAAVERAIDNAVRLRDVKLVAVDYAQLIRGNGDNKEQRVGDVSTRLKNAAIKHDIIVLLLAQLNRGIESRDAPEPQLSDLRDSGSLENDADVALFPFWPWMIDNQYEDRFEYRVYQRKNRNRGIGDECLTMRIDPARQRLVTIKQVPDSTPDSTPFDGDFR